MRIVLLALVIGAVITDWAHLRFRHRILEAEVEDLKVLTARYDGIGREQENALLSCRGMVDRQVEASQRSALFAVVAAERMRWMRRKQRTLMASVGLPHGRNSWRSSRSSARE